MHPCEAVRVAKKIIPWIPRANQDWRAALETLIGYMEAAIEDQHAEVREDFRRLLDQLEEPV